MPGLPGLTKAENLIYARLRKILMASQRYKWEGGDNDMGKRDDVKLMCVTAMASTMEETIPIEDSRVVAKHGNSFVRILENTHRKKVFDNLNKRRKQARKKIKKILEGK